MFDLIWNYTAAFFARWEHVLGVVGFVLSVAGTAASALAWQAAAGAERAAGESASRVLFFTQHDHFQACHALARELRRHSDAEEMQACSLRLHDLQAQLARYETRWADHMQKLDWGPVSQELLKSIQDSFDKAASGGLSKAGWRGVKVAARGVAANCDHHIASLQKVLDEVHRDGRRG